jgi:hypothetical protein
MNENLNLKPRYNQIPDEFIPLLKLHTKAINKLHFEYSDKWMIIAEKTGNTLALIAADFKCEKCGVEKDLTIHHMIKKSQRGLCDDRKYIPQRHYFENQIVLCKKEHAEEEMIDPDIMLPISEEKINKIKNEIKNGKEGLCS